MKVAIYARYSSDNQRDASIADQIRVCRLFADREGWLIADDFHDHAVSGATLLLYVGRLIWNRLRYIKNPDTRRRVSRLNPRSE